MKKLNIAMIGSKFMGKAHSGSWSRVHRFFDVPFEPVLKVVCGRPGGSLQAFADRWGWESISTDWKETVNRTDVDIVDIAAPTFLHHDMAIEAAKAGKHVFCEKPLCLTHQQAIEMCAAAEKAGIVHYLNHNYRRCPAVSLAKQLIQEGRLGQLFHWRSAYLQSWIVDPEFPLTWHLRKETAGSGPHADLNSHLVDLARFLVGDITEVTAMTAQFVEDRPLPYEGSSGAFQAGQVTEAHSRGPVTVEDAAFAGGQSQTNAATQGDNAPVRPPYSAFQPIARNNIFDPNRRPNRVRDDTRIKPPTLSTESFALVGIMSYDKGTFAFFDGTSSGYRKTLKRDDSIAGYKVAHIATDAVKLAAGTNQVELRVGMRMRREGEGAWAAAEQSEAFTGDSAPATAAPASSGQTQAATGGPNNDVLERLRKKREQE